jgi:hypothetical protein
MARTVQKEAGRSRNSTVAVPVPNAIESQALVTSERGDGKISDDELRWNKNDATARDQSVERSGTSGTELEDWLAAKKEFDRQLKRL